MELSLDQINWYSSIPKEVIQTQIKTNFEAEPVGVVNTTGAPILTAVTTTNLIDFKNLLCYLIVMLYTLNVSLFVIRARTCI